jgi:ubiquinone/menaquinone biosynthesis C-methylase UbiE
MNDWIDYYDSTHTIYASKLHRNVHFEIVAADIISYIPSPDSVVLDYACGEALSAPKVANACARLILAEPAPGVRGRLADRFAPNAKISVRSLDDLNHMEAGSVDLAIMNSCSQYMSSQELDTSFQVVRRLLKPDGRLVIGDVLQVNEGTLSDVMALLKFAAQHGFLKDAMLSLVRTALSDYRHVRSKVGLQRYDEADIFRRLSSAGLCAARETVNIGHNQSRMTFVARPKN